MSIIWSWLMLLLLSGGTGGHVGEVSEVSETQPQLVRERVFPHREMGDVLNNPYIGLVPSAGYMDFPLPYRMVYKVLTWAELEPEAGRYAFEEIERKYRMNEFYTSRRASFILRVVMDVPGRTPHKDIPEWLYKAIDGDGVWYNVPELGQGFSPAYTNETLLIRHRQLLQAMGARYNRDPRVAFLALGSLGHWGEWHTHSGKDVSIPFPPLAVSDRYVQHYVEHFPDKKLMMRRPHPVAELHGMGLYNDMFGSTRATGEFINWFENGYRSTLAGAELPGMPDFWKFGPSGGEFGNAGIDGEYFGRRFDEVIAMTRRSHLSWVGPSTGIERLPANQQHQLRTFLNTMGYRYVLRSAAVPEAAAAGSNAKVTLALDNVGAAPFYYDWKLELSLLDDEGHVLLSHEANADIRQLLPGSHRLELELPLPRWLPQARYGLGFAILDPHTGQPGVELAIEGKRPDGRYKIAELQVAGKLR